MGYAVEVIEAVRGETPPQLLTALADLGSSIRVFRLDDLWKSPENPEVDIFLVSARITASDVGEITLRYQDSDPPPIVLVFTETHFEHLDQHIRRGRDYLIPPFLPSLLRARMRTCYERARFTQSVEEAEARARLVATDREMEIGREIQVGFLPRSLPQPTGWQLEARFQPARRVSGDFYDAFKVANGRRIAFVVADVCDKGVGAALFMALIRSLLRHAAEYSGLQSLAVDQFIGAGSSAGPQADLMPVVGATPMMNAIRSTNGYLTRNHGEQAYFATLFFGILDPATGNIAYVNCGHNPPILLGASGMSSTTLEHTGPAVGVIPDCMYALGHTRLEPGETLFIYTDGVTEARNPAGEFLGEPQLLSIACLGTATGRDIIDRVQNSLSEHIGDAEQFDDITMMTIHRLPRSAQPAVPE